MALEHRFDRILFSQAVNKSLADALKSKKKAAATQSASEKKDKKVFVKSNKGGAGGDKKHTGGKPQSKKDYVSKGKKDFSGKEKKGDGKKVAPAWDRKTSKPNYAVVEKLKLNWNKARLKNISDVERTAVVNDMAKQVDQHILAVTLRHDASRAVQSIIQFGTVAQRTKVLADIKDKLHEVCNHYCTMSIIIQKHNGIIPC